VKRSIYCHLLAVLLAAGCSSRAGERNSSLRLALTAADSAVFAGDRTHLVASFDGDEASIDGIGAVESGAAIRESNRTSTPLNDGGALLTGAVFE